MSGVPEPVWQRVERVLVVDDDPFINRLLAARLATRRLEVDSASNGEEALEAVEDHPPDVVFLDVSMPGISGLEVLRRLRHDERDLAVVMTTAFGSEEVATAALREGADDYLRKPFEPKEFDTVLNRTITRLELARQNRALRETLDVQRKQLLDELSRAARVQADLLPDRAPDAPRLDIAGFCLPANEVGGDFYDWQVREDGSLAVTVADVMGKGMPAALLMTTVRAAVRAVAPGAGPGGTMSAVDRALAPDLDRTGSLITAIHAQVHGASGECRFVDAGHGHGFVRRVDGTVLPLQPRGLPLGFDETIPYEEGLLVLEPGDLLVLYSDGVLECQPDLNRPEDVAQLLPGLAGSAEELTMAFRLNVVGDQTVLADDLTVVIVRRTAS